MFILYAVVIGLAAGLALGGRPDGLADIRFRLSWLAIAGLLVQLVLFTDPVASSVGTLGPVIYVTSTLAVFAAVVANWRLRGMPIVALGAASNLAAILANGGYMPAAPGALAALDRASATVYSNSSVVANPVLSPLIDAYALPLWIPGHNVFSVGDVLIGIGIAVTIALAMRAGSVRANT